MIISASYKTDIPTFYGEWFKNRLESGYCKMVNPYNRRVYKVSLRKEDVDGFVFWTKNIGPFLEKLAFVQERGYPFIVQYTINGYPRILEFSVVDADRSIEHMKTIAAAYGGNVAVWRYDPILLSSETSVDFHYRNFDGLAKRLEGTTDEVVVSFVQLYRKTLRNMNWAAEQFDFGWEDPTDETKLQMTEYFAEIAASYGMQLRMCSQDKYLVKGVGPARCIDAERLSEIAGYSIGAKVKGNRSDCGCHLSKDIGEYDTCPHGCVYCYAVLNRDLARERYKEHDPNGEFLFIPNQEVSEEVSSSEEESEPTAQIRLL